jgi:nucleotide-binding universal stress UspA family protein
VTPRPPLPGRILIPVANPATAEELIRIGAALLDPRAGELTALGIVEVPEEMPLSEGATKARQARRLLQKVLDYAPEGTHVRPVVRIGRRAAQGIVEAAVELEADLVIFGWGGRPGGRSASGARGPRGAWVPFGVARTPSWHSASRTRWPGGTAPVSRCSTLCRRASRPPFGRRPSRRWPHS